MVYIVNKTREGFLYKHWTEQGELIKMHYIGYPKSTCRAMFSKYLKDKGVK